MLGLPLCSRKDEKRQKSTMSRSGYSCDIENWALIRWRGAVNSAMKGKRGQAFFKEMRDSLLALPEKKLIYGSLSLGGQVCSLGCVMVSRKMAEGMSREEALGVVEDNWSGDFLEDIPEELNIANAMAKEIMFENDDDWHMSRTDEDRYNYILGWVNRCIIGSEAI